jgi:hypothetical protein
MSNYVRAAVAQQSLDTLLAYTNEKMMSFEMDKNYGEIKVRAAHKVHQEYD